MADPGLVNESIDGGAYFIDMTYDKVDTLHIIYNWGGYVKYARKTGGLWTGHTQFSGNYASLVVDDANNPHIAYIDDGLLVYAFYDGMYWHKHYVTESGFAVYPTIALDLSGYPHISFADRNALNLQYATYDGSDWNVEYVASGMSQYWEHSSIDVDSQDIPHIAYRGNETMRYASRNPFWNSVTLDSTTNTGINCSLAIDANDVRHISYWTYSDWGVRYIKGNSTQTIGEGSYTKIAVDPGNHAQILYYDDHNVYYWANGSSSFVETIGSYYAENWRIDIAVNSRGQPALAYWSSDLGLVVNDASAAPQSTGFIPGSGGSFRGSDGVTLIIPGGSFTDTVVMTYTAQTAVNTGLLTSSGYAFGLNAVYSDTGLTAQLAPGASFTTVISYTNIGPVIENEDFGLYGWDTGASVWSRFGITNTLYADDNVLNAEVNHLSQFALLGDTNRIFLSIVLR